MAYEISDECINCSLCVDECPQEAIEEGDDHYLIDHDKCTACGICVEVCPVTAVIEIDS